MLKRTDERFEVLDLYDFVEVLYVGNDISEAYTAACRRINNMGQGCDIYIRDYSLPASGYIPVLGMMKKDKE